MSIQGQHRDTAAVNSTLRVIEIDVQTDPRWEALVTALPRGLIYHHPAWLKVLEEAFDYKPVHLACEDANGDIRGILPLFYKRGLLTGRQFSSLPRTPVAGPLTWDEQATRSLICAALERTSIEQGSQLQIKVLSNALDGLVDQMVGRPWRETYVLELPERPGLLRFGGSRDHARIRWSINKATRLGVEIHPAETERELQAWYKLYLDTMRELAVPPRPYHFFEAAWRQLWSRGLMRLLLAERYEAGQARLLAGSLFLLFGQTVFYAFTGWRREDLSLRPNDVIQWRALHDACEEGFRFYDFGEVTKGNEGLAQFKSKWGAEPRWLYRYYYPAPREVEAGFLDSSGPGRQLMSAAWRQLPLKATALLSDLAHHYF
jgi:hypothetical protein